MNYVRRFIVIVSSISLLFPIMNTSIVNAQDDTGWKNVKTYGAKGDGIADDYSAIVRAISDAEHENGVVFFPPGTYRFTQKLEVTEYISINGSGMDSTFLFADNCDGINVDPLEESSGYIGTRKGDSLCGFTLKTNKQGLHTAISLADGSYTIRDLRFISNKIVFKSYWSRCIFMQNTWFSTIDNIHIENPEMFSNPQGCGIYMEYSVNNIITNSHLLGLAKAIELSNVPRPELGHVCEGITISNSIIMGCHDGIELDAVGTAFITNNIIDMLLGTGIYIHGELSGVYRGLSTITGNYFGFLRDSNENQTFAIHIKEGSQNHIIGNRIACGHDEGCGILIGARGSMNTISNNRIEDYLNCIQIAGERNLVESNTMRAPLNSYAVRITGPSANKNTLNGNTVEYYCHGFEIESDFNIINANSFHLHGSIPIEIKEGKRGNIVTSNHLDDGPDIIDHGIDSEIAHNVLWSNFTNE